jgi:hypothetical protein
MNFSSVSSVAEGMITHQPYPSDVSDAEWELILPYLCLLPEDAGQRVHNLCDVFDALAGAGRGPVALPGPRTSHPGRLSLSSPGAG